MRELGPFLLAVIATTLIGALSACGGNTPTQETAPGAAESVDPWQRVERLAEPAVAPGDPALLLQAAGRIAAHRQQVDERWALHDKRCAPPAWSATAREAIDQSIASLVRWHQSGGGVPRVACRDVQTIGELLHVLPVAQAALMQAEETENPANLAAVLYLGHRLRREGTTMLHIVIGSEVSHQALQWARYRAQATVPAFESWRPRQEDILRALAVEARCQVAMIKTLRDPDDEARGQFRAMGGELPASPTDAWVADELTAVRQYNQQMIDMVQAGLDDKAADEQGLIRALQAHTERARSSETSLVLPLVAMNPSVIQTLLEHHRTYHDHLGGKTPDAVAMASVKPTSECPDRNPGDGPVAGDVVSGNQPTSPDDRALAAELDAGIRRVSDTHHVVGKSLWQRLQADPAPIVRGARIVPSIKNGAPDGFKLHAIRPGSFWHEVGFRDGDTLHTINGHALTTPDKALETYTRLRDADRLEIAVTRVRDRSITLIIEIESPR